MSTNVQVYTFETAFVKDDDLSRAWSVLDDDERRRAERFVFDEDRHLFVVAHGLLRFALSRHTAESPAAHRFDLGEHGRPELRGNGRVRFNLSHTKGLAAVAIVDDGRDVGVDVENIDRPTDFLAVCDRFFSPFEVETLRALPEHEHRERFFRYWTLKEAYIKARGMGLAIPLHHFSFLLDEGPEPRIRFAPELDDDPDRWLFQQRPIGASHLLAVCIEKRPSQGPLLSGQPS